jgi:hypothetical protein
LIGKKKEEKNIQIKGDCFVWLAGVFLHIPRAKKEN